MNSTTTTFDAMARDADDANGRHSGRNRHRGGRQRRQMSVPMGEHTGSADELRSGEVPDRTGRSRGHGSDA